MAVMLSLIKKRLTLLLKYLWIIVRKLMLLSKLEVNECFIEYTVQEYYGQYG